MKVALVPDEVIERFAREEYARKYADVPPPTPVNVDALLVFTQPREFTWGGVGYRAPPLPFLAGVKLLVSVNALQEATDADQVERILGEAARLVRQVARPRRLLLRALWRLTPNPFRRGDPVALVRLVYQLLEVPDAVPLEPPTRKGITDFMDGLTGFVRAFPAWTGPDGLPRSWAHYIHASRHLSRTRVREMLLDAIATRVADAEERSFQDWYQDRLQAAGWN